MVILNYNKDEIFNIFKEQVMGKKEININDFTFNISLNYYIPELKEQTIIDSNLPVLHISDLETFKSLLFEYVKAYYCSETLFTNPEKFLNSLNITGKSKLIYLLSNLFTSADFNDFENPLNYIKTSTNFLLDKTILPTENWNDLGQLENFKSLNILYKITEQSSFYETPYRLELKIGEQNSFGGWSYIDLPFISFGISDKSAHIYAIQSKNRNKYSLDDEQKHIEKKVNRARFKLNSNIDKESLDIEPLSLISATVLMGIFKSYQIENIFVHSFLPIRYNAKQKANIKRSAGSQDKLLELNKEQQRIQTNLTDRFIKLFYRLSDQVGNLEIQNDISQQPSYIKIKIVDSASSISTPILDEMFTNSFKK